MNLAGPPTGLPLEAVAKEPCKKNVYAEKKVEFSFGWKPKTFGNYLEFSLVLYEKSITVCYILN